MSHTDKVFDVTVGRSIARFASEQQDCERERIWIYPVTSKIEFQPLDTDNDAQLHKESVITVRKAAEICLSNSTRETSRVECGHPGNAHQYGAIRVVVFDRCAWCT